MKPTQTLAAILATAFLSGCSGKKEEPQTKTEAITVETATAKTDTIQTWTFAEGTARATRREYLNFENAGRIVFVAPDLKEGDEVKEGTLITNQDQRKLKADLQTAASSVTEAETQADVAEAELEQAKTEQALKKTTFSRYEELLRRESASRQEFDEAKAGADNAATSVTRANAQLKAARAQIDAAGARLNQAEIALEQTEIRSPIDGTLARLNVVEGFYTTPSLVRTENEEALLQSIPVLIIDRSSLEITVEIPALGTETVKQDQRAFIRPGGGDGMEMSEFDPAEFPVHGKVYSVTPSISPGKRTIQVKIRTTEGGEHLQDGTFTTVWIETLKQEDAIVVPIDSFVYRDNKPFAYVIGEDGKAHLKPVELGLQSIDSQSVASGIEAGEKVVTRGRHQLSDGAAVKILNKETP